MIKKIVTKHPVIVYYIACLLLWVIFGLTNMALFPTSFNYELVFPQWAPAFAAFIVVGISGGKTGILGLLQKVSIKKSSIKWGLASVVIPVVCCVIAYIGIMYTEFGQCTMPTFTRSIGIYAICFLATLFGSYGEEIGWRGFMLPQLNKKHSLLMSSVIVGMSWGLWHINIGRFGLIAFGLFILGLTCISLLISWLCSKTKNNIFVAIMFHTIMNFCTLLLFENVLSDFSQMQTGAHIADMHLYTILYGMYLIVFAIPCIFIVKNMSGKKTKTKNEYL
ncbi:MAG: CPBP family intramembrane metalloprotease [Tannerella sp.]|jgi:membrane protease YdiL (CAAX protease family)|nr:CPBP family intramembrane metalloprotease [Tannerella sp.]